jgi:hypothetical protein
MHASVESAKSPLPFGWNPGFLLPLLACLFGGGVGGAIVHQIHPVFAYRDLPPIELGASAELVQMHRDAASQYRSHNYAIELAVAGLVLGLAFGLLAGGPKRMRAAIMGGLGGGLSGSASGFFGGKMVANSLFQNQQQTLQASMGLQAVVWGLIFASIVGFVAAANVGLMRSVRYALVGFIAGGAVAVVQFVVSSFVFPAANPLFLIPEVSAERIYWLIAFPIVSGLVLALGLRRKS